jgi:hypothetical protein
MSSRNINTDNLVTKNIFITATNNIYPQAGNVLVSDGVGNTFWSSITLYANPAYNIISGDEKSYPATKVTNNFKLLSGSGIGQLSSVTGSNGITLYSKGVQGIGTYNGGVVNAFTDNFLNPTIYFSSTDGLIDIIPLVGSNTILFSMSSSKALTNSTNSLIFVSTVEGLGSAGYLSSIYWSQELIKLSTTISLSASTVSTILRPSIESNVMSSIAGLGTMGYVSSSSNILTVSTSVSIGLSTVYNDTVSYVIPSTIAGLGSYGYFSDIKGFSNTSTNLTFGLSTVFSSLSTTQGIFSYITFPSTVAGLGSMGFISTLSDFSSIKTSTIRFQDYTTREEHRIFTSSSRLYFNSTIVTGSPTLNLQRFVL